MARRAIREYDAKLWLAHYLPDLLPGFVYPGKVALVDVHTNWEQLALDHPWITTERLVVKPDQLFGKRGKHGLLGVNLDLEEVRTWVDAHMGKEVTVGKVTDALTTFLIEPFVSHDQEEEIFIAIRTEREVDMIYFSLEGGIEIEENWDSVVQIPVPVLEKADAKSIRAHLPPFEARKAMAQFIAALHTFFVDLAFTYLEINPLAFLVGGDAASAQILPLDFVGQVDDTAAFEVGDKWCAISFPPAFGTRLTPEETAIRDLDEKGGSSLKLTVLNPRGRVWPMVAGGGASVIYADTVTDLGFGKELACYGEYSGNPSTDETREYACVFLDLMTREPDPEGRPKFLLIGGGIANFTDVAKTFTGIVDALRAYKVGLQRNKVRIYVRRGGPNYQEGLSQMRRLGEELGVPVGVFGPETHMTRIVTMALLQEEV